MSSSIGLIRAQPDAEVENDISWLGQHRMAQHFLLCFVTSAKKTPCCQPPGREPDHCVCNGPHDSVGRHGPLLRGPAGRVQTARSHTSSGNGFPSSPP